MIAGEPPEALLVDLHGTTLEMDLEPWFQEIARISGRSRERVLRAVRASQRERLAGSLADPAEMAERLCADLGAPDALVPELVASREALFASARIYPEVVPVLGEIRRRGYPIGLVTNCTAETRPLLTRLRLLPLFDALALSSDLGAVKPEPGIYLHACS